ncbi:hypothetical protein BKA62DRAFT_619584 [Auriculariales sp. MPI-PUGE-AT-0066]|nr:hypothetical protein BKA62DRAFT_619584 [Auriculariales sp. MPI-PUGE-AT-0066]
MLTLRGGAARRNVWAQISFARLLLNFKQIPYRTEWISYPDIEPTMIALKAAPTSQRADGSPFYTLPVIKDADSIISDSYDIADYIDRKYPTAHAAAFPPRTRAAQACILSFLSRNLLPVLRPLVIPHIHPILDPRGAAYMRLTREAQFGSTLEFILPLGTPEREAQWDKVARELEMVGAWFEESEGDWLGGTEPFYADLVLAAHFLWIIKGRVPDGWERVRLWHEGRWERFMDQCEPYIHM